VTLHGKAIYNNWCPAHAVLVPFSQTGFKYTSAVARVVTTVIDDPAATKVTRRNTEVKT